MIQRDQDYRKSLAYVFEPSLTGPLSAVKAKMPALVADPHIHPWGVRVAAIGRREILPPPLLEAIDAAREATSGNAQMTVTLAVGYGGREEIFEAVRALLADCARRGLSLEQAAEAVSPGGNPAASLSVGPAGP